MKKGLIIICAIVVIVIGLFLLAPLFQLDVNNEHSYTINNSKTVTLEKNVYENEDIVIHAENKENRDYYIVLIAKNVESTLDGEGALAFSSLEKTASERFSKNIKTDNVIYSEKVPAKSNKDISVTISIDEIYGIKNESGKISFDIELKDTYNTDFEIDCMEERVFLYFDIGDGKIYSNGDWPISMIDSINTYNFNMAYYMFPEVLYEVDSNGRQIHGTVGILSDKDFSKYKLIDVCDFDTKKSISDVVWQDNPARLYGIKGIKAENGTELSKKVSEAPKYVLKFEEYK